MKISKHKKFDYWETSEFDNLYEIIDFIMTLRLPKQKRKILWKICLGDRRGF